MMGVQGMVRASQAVVVVVEYSQILLANPNLCDAIGFRLSRVWSTVKWA